MNNQTKNNSCYIHGIIQMVLALLLLYHFGSLFYYYHFTNMLFYYMYPNWFLILFIIASFLGFLSGAAVFLKKLSIKHGYILLAILFLSEEIIGQIIIS